MRPQTLLLFKVASITVDRGPTIYLQQKDWRRALHRYRRDGTHFIDTGQYEFSSLFLAVEHEIAGPSEWCRDWLLLHVV